jgi:predicted nucleic acid-binding protein
MARKLIRVFVDSDVVISSLISTAGAAYTLLHNTKEVELYISNFSTLELEKVVDRLQLDSEQLQKVISTRFASVKISQTYKKTQGQFAHYVRDVDDAHIVAGAKEAKVTFLVSYNIRHFESEKLRQDFQIILLTPGLFLQYLRSL